MNLLLLHDADFLDTNTVRITARRAEHLIKVMKISVSSTIKAGKISGLIGTCTVKSIEKNVVTLTIEKAFSHAPAPASNIQLLLALPRPNMLRRILHHATELGIKDIHLFQSEKVEKSFWQSPTLSNEKIHETLCLGLEQSVDTILPSITIHKNQKQFLKDIEDIKSDRLALIAHPYQAKPCPTNLEQSSSILIGPEGGFSLKEVQTFNALGFKSVHIGQRILRVENAVTAILARLAHWS